MRPVVRLVVMKMQIRQAARCRIASRLLQIAIVMGITTAFPFVLATPVAAQSIPANSNYILSSDMPPGVVGAAQAYRRPQVQGYFQPVQVSGPNGLHVALAQDGQFLPLLEAPVRAGMMVGRVYRIKVSGIPGFEGEELFPSIEVIDRLYPPSGREHRFPIPVVLEEEDLRAALRGELVTRVIYLEDSEIAEPVSDLPGEQRVTEVGGSEDPLQSADQLGRPVAILRIGSRTPDLNGDLTDFLYGSPMWVPIKPIPEREKLIENGMWPATPAAIPPAATPAAEPSARKPIPAARPGSSSIQG